MQTQPGVVALSIVRALVGLLLAFATIAQIRPISYWLLIATLLGVLQLREQHKTVEVQEWLAKAHSFTILGLLAAMFFDTRLRSEWLLPVALIGVILVLAKRWHFKYIPPALVALHATLLVLPALAYIPDLRFGQWLKGGVASWVPTALAIAVFLLTVETVHGRAVQYADRPESE